MSTNDCDLTTPADASELTALAHALVERSIADWNLTPLQRHVFTSMLEDARRFHWLCEQTWITIGSRVLTPDRCQEFAMQGSGAGLREAIDSQRRADQ
jgi:hypothetical protein